MTSYTLPRAKASSPTESPFRITLIGAGTIGLSFAALYINQAKHIEVTIHDVRPDIESYVYATLPAYLDKSNTKEIVQSLIALRKLRIITDLQEAVKDADAIQEQGPENAPFKQQLWPQIEQYASKECLFWSSTSGIPASVQSARMKAQDRLVVVHPYNPPHVMPLIEIVPSPATNDEVLARTVAFWEKLGREPVVIKKEVTGFVANRLAFVLLREAVHLVNEGVVSARDLDRVVESSMGPRWAVAGPFKSYHMGGGAGGLEAFMKNIGGTVQACWDDAGKQNVGEGWEENVIRQTKEAYGDVKRENFTDRDERTKAVLAAAKKAEEFGDGKVHL